MTIIELSQRFDNPYDFESVMKSAEALGLIIPDGYSWEVHSQKLAEIGIVNMNNRTCCGAEKPPEISIGVGDTVAKITHATGLDKLAKLYTEITGKDCGCKTRQAALNKLLPYKTK